MAKSSFDDNERRYLKAIIPLSLRRSISFEDLSNVDIKSNYFPNRNTNSTLSSSLQSLCVQLRPHQLLDEFNSNIAKSDEQHRIDWWKTIAHLRPFIEKLIFQDQLENHFEEDENKIDKIFIKFNQSQSIRRRNAICCAIDRLCFNEQLILFVAITNDVQIEYNLMSSGFKV